MVTYRRGFENMKSVNTHEVCVVGHGTTHYNPMDYTWQLCYENYHQIVRILVDIVKTHRPLRLKSPEWYPNENRASEGKENGECEEVSGRKGRVREKIAKVEGDYAKLNKRFELDNNDFTKVTKVIKTRDTEIISMKSDEEEENRNRNFYEILSDEDDDDIEDESSEDTVKTERVPTREILLSDFNTERRVIEIKDDSTCKLKSALEDRISALKKKEEQVQKEEKKHENLCNSCKLNNTYLFYFSGIMNEERRYIKSEEVDADYIDEIELGSNYRNLETGESKMKNYIVEDDVIEEKVE